MKAINIKKYIPFILNYQFLSLSEPGLEVIQISQETLKITSFIQFSLMLFDLNVFFVRWDKPNQSFV